MPISTGLPIIGAATASIRRTFALRHLWAANHFAGELIRLEQEHDGAGLGAHFDVCSWNATAALIMSFSAIEAAIDESEDDIGLPAELTSALSKAPTLDRAQAYLVHKGAIAFDRGAEPFQSTELLRVIRNGFVHPRAEWDHSQDLNRRLSQRILAAQLPMSPFWPDSTLAFPHGCMSAGTAEWAVETARKFIVEYRTRLELEVAEPMQRTRL